jgi:hypothetical protein
VTGARFVPNPAADDLVAAMPELEPVMSSLASSAASTARGLAPVDTGAYRDSIGSESGLEGGERMANVYADAEHAQYVEFGTSRVPPFAVLRRAAETLQGR